MKKETFDLSVLNPKNLPELQGWEDKQKEIVKDNPFIEIKDNASYEEGKKRRTTLVSARTSIEKQDRLIATTIKNFRTKVSLVSKELIDITLPHETKQQEEVKKYEAEKEAERQLKIEEERQRVLKIKEAIEKYEQQLHDVAINLQFKNIDKVHLFFNTVVEDIKVGFDFAEFELMFDEAVDRANLGLENKISFLEHEENQRLENERLKKEAEKAKEQARLIEVELEQQRQERAKEAKEAQEKLEIELMAKEVEFEKQRAEQLKKDEEEAKKRQELEAKLKKLEEEKADRLAEELRLKKEAEETIEIAVPKLETGDKVKITIDEALDSGVAEVIKAETLLKVEAIIDNLNTRSGFDDWWGNIDEEIQEDIQWELSKIIES